MRRTTQQERAEAFHRLHTGAKPLVLVNAWDAASARLFEEAGSPAIATTSAGMAWSLGYSDGERVSPGELLEACARICRIVTAPVSVDIERGYGRTAADVAATARALLELGVVGINIEDGLIPGTEELAPPEILTEKISAIRAVAEDIGVRLFINARTDVYLHPRMIRPPAMKRPCVAPECMSLPAPMESSCRVWKAWIRCRVCRTPYRDR